MPTVNRSKIQSLNFIVSSTTQFGSTRAYYEKQVESIRRGRNIKITIPFDKPILPNPVYARIYSGQWIADCECTGATLVSPEDGFFFCFDCLNRDNGGQLRKVLFPEDRELIEAEILRRPVNDTQGLDDWERAGRAKPLVYHIENGGLSRDWVHGETLDDIREQNKAIDKWEREIRKK